MRDEIESIVNKSQCGRTPVDLFKIANQFCIKIMLCSKAQWDCAIDIYQQPTIYVSDKLSFTKKRWVIAMLMGSYFLNKNHKTAIRIKLEKTKFDLQMAEMNMFALALLVDEFELRACLYCGVPYTATKQLANRFQVSEDIIKIKLNQIYGDNLCF